MQRDPVQHFLISHLFKALILLFIKPHLIKHFQTNHLINGFHSYTHTARCRVVRTKKSLFQSTLLHPTTSLSRRFKAFYGIKVPYQHSPPAPPHQDEHAQKTFDQLTLSLTFIFNRAYRMKPSCEPILTQTFTHSRPYPRRTFDRRFLSYIPLPQHSKISHPL